MKRCLNDVDWSKAAQRGWFTEPSCIPVLPSAELSPLPEHIERRSKAREGDQKRFLLIERGSQGERRGRPAGRK